MELLKLILLDPKNLEKSVLVCYSKYLKLLEELEKHAIPDEVVLRINEEIEQINASKTHGKLFKEELRKSQERILQMAEQELKLLPKYANRKRWLVMGFSLFGISFGVAFGVIVGNMVYLGVGIPFGIVVGVIIGEILDHRVFTDGRQLDIDF